MRKMVQFTLLLSMLSVAALVFSIAVPMKASSAAAADETDGKVESKFKAVDDMHHFMEYINEPVYKDLKAELAKQPVTKLNWKKIKSDAMILAETSSLLAKRGESGESDWVTASLTVHENGKLLFHAARAKDLPAAKKHFAAMSKGCASCHELFR